MIGYKKKYMIRPFHDTKVFCKIEKTPLPT